MIDSFNLWLVGHGFFLAIIHMRGRKPRHISSETEKFWLVGYISNPNKYKGYNGV